MKIPRMTRSLLFMVLLVSVMMIVTPQGSHAYTTCDGIETGDQVVADYVLSFENGTKYQEGDDFSFTAKTGQGGVVQGFYEGVLGMKIGERKEIVVPPSKGYDTGPLADLTLIFDVYIEDIASEIVTCGADDGGSGFGSFLWNFIGWAAGIAVVGFIGVTLYFSVQKTTTAKCVHCSSEGRDRLSEGKCGKCGKAYCRQSFSRGCPNCKSNTFVPNK